MLRRDDHLADGRELFYYSTGPSTVDPVHDRRDLDRNVIGAGEIRFDALLGEWVSIAGHRQTRIFLPDVCPLCPSTAETLTEVPAPDYEVVVFENRFPSFAMPALPWELPATDLAAQGVNAGRCEVVCFSPNHDAAFSELPPARVRLIIDAWADRTSALMAVEAIAVVAPFENRGVEIGVTLHHPHGQIYGYPMLPPVVQRKLDSAARHRAATGRSLIEDLIEREERDAARVLVATEHWVAFVPFAARWPFQIQLHPRRRAGSLAELTAAERDDLAVTYPAILRSLDAVFDVPMPYMAAWFQAPRGVDAADARLHLDVLCSRRAPDKLKFLASSESALGAFINDIRPEDAAAILRKGLA